MKMNIPKEILDLIDSIVCSISDEKNEIDELKSDCYLAYLLKDPGEVNNKQAWWNVIFRRTCYDYYRYHKVRSKHNENFLDPEEREYTLETSKSYEISDLTLQLSIFADQMPSNEYQLLESLVCGQTYADIGRLTNRTLSSVRQKIVRTREKWEKLPIVREFSYESKYK